MTYRRKLVAGVVAALAVTGAGAAVAATQLGSPSEESKAIIDDAAKQLGVDPTKLSDALKQAYANRIDAAVAAGRLTKEQGDAIKERIAAADSPLLFGPGFGFHKDGHGFRADLAVAATYLGVTAEELRTSLTSGKTLAEVAKAEGKSVDGLVDAMVAAETKELDDAVAAGKLTKAQRDEIVSTLKERTTELVNNGRPKGGPEFHQEFHQEGVVSGVPGI